MERFQKEGMDQFDEMDTVGLLLDLARCPGDRTDISRRLLDEYGSLKGVLEAREEQLIKVDGIGQRTAAMIRMVLPFARAWERTVMQYRDKISNANDAAHFCKSLLMGYRNERFCVICLDTKCKVLGQKIISEGSLNEVNAYPRMVLETALNHNAHSILLCHNHPGGTNAPSSEDIASTITLQRLLNGVGILLLDHIIVAGCDTYSMVQHGDIDYRVRR